MRTHARRQPVNSSPVHRHVVCMCMTCMRPHLATCSPGIPKISENCKISSFGVVASNGIPSSKPTFSLSSLVFGTVICSAGVGAGTAGGAAEGWEGREKVTERGGAEPGATWVAGLTCAHAQEWCVACVAFTGLFACHAWFGFTFWAAGTPWCCAVSAWQALINDMCDGMQSSACDRHTCLPACLPDNLTHPQSSQPTDQPTNRPQWPPL